jgi:hypothetical protein
MEPRLFAGMNLLKAKITHHETVQDFRIRFQKMVDDAGWKDNYQTAQVCLNALPAKMKEDVVNTFVNSDDPYCEKVNYRVPETAAQVMNLAMKHQGLNSHKTEGPSYKRNWEDSNPARKRPRAHKKCIHHPH